MSNKELIELMKRQLNQQQDQIKLQRVQQNQMQVESILKSLEGLNKSTDII